MRRHNLRCRRSVLKLCCTSVLRPSPTRLSDTKNIINDQAGGYENVVEYIPIGTPNAGTLAKLNQLTASSVYGDREFSYFSFRLDLLTVALDFLHIALDAVIVGLETQSQYLGKKAWTKKMYLITDGQGPIELEDWEMTADKMNETKVKMFIV